MNRERPETGILIAGLGGILLLVSLFMAWYTLPGFTVTGWTAFEVWDLVLAGLAIGVAVSVAAKLGWWRGPTHAVGLELLGLAAVVIVVSQLIDRPPAALHGGIGDGGWLGLVGAILMVGGGLMAESRVTVSFNAGSAEPGVRTAAWRRPRGGSDRRGVANVGATDVPLVPRAPRVPSRPVGGADVPGVPGRPGDAGVPRTPRPPLGDRDVAGPRDDEETAVVPPTPRAPRR